MTDSACVYLSVGDVAKPTAALRIQKSQESRMTQQRENVLDWTQVLFPLPLGYFAKNV